MKEGEEAGPAPQIVTRQDGKWQDSGLAPTDSLVYDAVVCGGTLGIFFATALALKGKKVAIVERLQLRGDNPESEKKKKKKKKKKERKE
ncbi:hypothetical protein CBR_g8455 [Chara braunii]|uniref:Uncharacterized protein n=1 Tax=Chara braunii TaxID=69332 RepID=A0A388KMI6_CHABU|nr:hypothetical protein CBR_g8455 [Chara braunii]|eukprot:GBG71153.1 hypothetical protein CBR_g8455 [Chara braunii]